MLVSSRRPVAEPTRHPLAPAAVATLWIAALASAGAQQPVPVQQRPASLPATAPTSPQPAAATAPPAYVPPPAPPPAPPMHRPVIEYAHGELVINADNSSLNEILREIARKTGMKISGGVTEEHVYGTYGPDRAQEVLTRLLDGSGANILIFENPDNSLRELVLSTRTGGATPPSPSASRDTSSETDLPPQSIRHIERGNRNLRERAEELRRQDLAAPNNPPQAPVQPNPGLNNQQSPNGVKTPQQIYNELNNAQGTQPASSGTSPQPTQPPASPQ